MTVAVTLERQRLAQLHRALDAYVADLPPDRASSGRLDVLEGIAALHGGFPAACLRERLPPSDRLPLDLVEQAAERLIAPVAATGIPVPLVIASLAQPALQEVDRRRAGAYYTDFRLAEYLAGKVAERLPKDGVVLDPACGSGVLLAAVVHRLIAGGTPPERALERVAGADLSARALRSCATTLAAFAPDPEVVSGLVGSLLEADSLKAPPYVWQNLAPRGIAAIVTNPPWEKLKLSRHEMLQHAGIVRHYGAGYEEADLGRVSVAEERSKLRGYAGDLADRYVHQGSGEDDLYKLFLELAFRLVSPGGEVALIVPAGLIRSLGTASLRSLVFNRSEAVSITVFENRARFFAIDTRFKFLVLRASVGPGDPAPLSLLHATGTDSGVREQSSVDIPRGSLASLRPDLSVPEVRDQAEWDLFKRMSGSGRPLDGSDTHWRMDIDREVDMTNDRPLFAAGPGSGMMPLVEGRMVHQFRYGAKAYQSGTGRRATWRVLPMGSAASKPQYWIRGDRLAPALRTRVARPRIGFCDVTGQTNERSMLAALVPAGVACGNKVPTVLLDVPPEQERDSLALWLAIANSLPFDWLLRRIITTTVNFFLLRSLTFPPVWINEPSGRRLIDLAQCVLDADRPGSGVDAWTLAMCRAAIDAEVAVAWSLSVDDAEVLLRDFPLLDRRQPPLAGDQRSTVTADSFKLALVERLGIGDTRQLRARLFAARELGAVGYQPSEYVASLGRQAKRGG